MDTPIYKIITLSIFKGSISYEMFGWYHDKDTAFSAVKTNTLDMQDCQFNYALISRSYQGGYGLKDQELQWFTWSYKDNKWEECERPEKCRGMYIV